MKKLLFILLATALMTGIVSCNDEDETQPKPTPTLMPPVPTATPMATPCPDGSVKSPDGLNCVVPPTHGVWCPIDEVDFGPCLPADWFQQPENKSCQPIGKRVSGRNLKGGCSPVACKFSCNPVMNYFKELMY